MCMKQVIVVSRGHMIQLICTMSMQAINHPKQYDTDHRIYYIDQLVKFDYGTATTKVVTTFVSINGGNPTDITETLNLAILQVFQSCCIT